MERVRCETLVIGAGPAGLMAAETLAASGRAVLLAEARPSIGRKLLMAGKSGLNLTRVEDRAAFVAAFGAASGWLAPMLRDFGPGEVQVWAEGLGQALFTGTTGRVFPVAMKASPLLRAWAARLAAGQVRIETRWRFQGWQGAAAWFATPSGDRLVDARATVLAMGGASWPRLGSDGAWAAALAAEGVALAPFAPANAGIAVDWSPFMARVFGTPLKGVAFTAGGIVSRGEAVISARGLEGGGIYPLTPAIRTGARLVLDLLPDLDAGRIAARLARRRGKTSLANHLRKSLGLDPARRALLREFGPPRPDMPEAPEALAARIKALDIVHRGPRPLAEAISTAGGVQLAALGAGLMLTSRPGVFAAGEMLDWEAPTGGYLLTACLATGRSAGLAAHRFLLPGDPDLS